MLTLRQRCIVRLWIFNSISETFVRPHLDYVQVQLQFFQKDVVRLDWVQFLVSCKGQMHAHSSEYWCLFSLQCKRSRAFDAGTKTIKNVNISCPQTYFNQDFCTEVGKMERIR